MRRSSSTTRRSAAARWAGAWAVAGALAAGEADAREGEGSKMGAEITRGGEGLDGVTWNILGQVYHPKAITESSFAFEALVEPGQFAPAHVQPTQEVFILVQEGGLEVEMDGERSILGPGDLVVLPRGVAQGYANVSEAPARALMWASPAGRMPDLFRAIDGLDDPAEVARISAEHDIEFLPAE